MAVTYAPKKKPVVPRVRQPLPAQPEIDLSRPGRLRPEDVAGLLRIARSTLRAGVASGRYPKPYYEGVLAFWPTEVIREYLANPTSNPVKTLKKDKKPNSGSGSAA
jgi:hypothetical protein